MRKNFKFLTGALGLLALASCSTDDLQGVKGGEYDYSNKIVMHVTVQPDNEGDDMRALVSEGGAYTWVAGDKLRAYDGKLQAYDEFTVLGNAFVLPIDEAVIEDPADYAYVVKAEEGNISFAGWNNKKNLALVRIGWDVVDGTPTKGITYEETTEYSEDGTAMYRTAVPLYGFPTITRGEGDKIDLAVSLKRLTSQIKVVFENGSNSGATAVRARSLKLSTSHNVTIAQLLEIAEAAKGENEYPVFDELAYNSTVFTDLLEANDATPMSGWFQAELDMDAASTSKLQPVADNTGAINTSDNEPEIVVNIQEQSMQEYTNVVYLPIVSQLYDLLVIEYYDTADNKWHYLAGRGNVTPPTTGTMEAGVVTSGMSATVETFEDLQAVINRAAKVGADIEVAVTITADLDVPESGKLYLPANLTHHVTLNIVGLDGKFIGGRTGNANVAIVNEEGATGELTFNNAKFFDGVSVDVKAAKLGLDGEIRGTFAVASADTLKLGSMNFSSTGLIAPLNLGAAPVVIDGTVQLGTTGLGIVTTDNVIVKGTGKAFTIVNAKNITLEKGAVANALIATNDVTVDSAKVNNYITVSAGTVTINNEEKENKLELEIPVINVTGNGKVVLNNGFVKKITNAVKGDDDKYTATDITIESAGKSAIQMVDSIDHATITSVWDGKYHTGMTQSGVYKDYLMNGRAANATIEASGGAVYTATQLANVQGIRITGLYADIALNETAEGTNLWKGLETRTRAFSGNGHTVKNVVLDVKNGAKGFFNAVIPDTDKPVTISGLTIDGLKAEGALQNVAALVGQVDAKADVTIKDVAVQNASLKGDGTSNNVAGLVAWCGGGKTLTVTGTTIDAIVEGYYNLGVVFGYASQYANIVVGDEDNKVTVKATSAINVTKEYESVTTKDDNAGKVGIVIGELNGKLNLANFASSYNSKNIDVNAWRYDLCNILVKVVKDGATDNQWKTLYFKGGYGNENTAQYWIGYSPKANDSEDYKKGTAVQTSCYNGTEQTYTAPEKNKAVYNVFE